MNNKLDSETLKTLTTLYRDQLIEIMSEWADHTLDLENGGYLTNFDENWNITGDNKNVWAHARQTYMFAAMYSNIEKNEKWLRVSKAGRDFLVAHANAGNGRWNYELDSTGNKVLVGAHSIFSDLFVLSALSQYAAASDSNNDLQLIKETFEAAEKNIRNPDFKDIFPHKWLEGIERHSVYMIAVNAAGIAGQVLGRDTVRPLIQLCLDKIINFFGNNESGYLLESLKKDGSVWDTEEGRTVNPGHIFEGMWFCIHEAFNDNNQEYILPKALKILDAVSVKAFDKTNGGIIHRFDCYDKPLVEFFDTDPVELEPDYKVDWVHCEALYTLALVAILTEDDERIKTFKDIHGYCQEYFRPESGGDWYPVLAADGKVLKKNKGGKHRVAFHVPRALMNIVLLFQKYADKEKL